MKFKVGESIRIKKKIKKYQKEYMSDTENYLFGTFCSEPVGLSLNSPVRDSNHLVVGSAGTGKTYNYMLSNLRQENHSAVVLDYSLSLKNEEARFKEKGIKTHRFNLHHPEKSSRYNPFLHVKTEQQTEILVENILRFFDDHSIEIGPKVVLATKDFKDPFYSRLIKILTRLAVFYVVKSPNLTDEERTFKTLYGVWESLKNPFDVKSYDVTGRYSEMLEVLSINAFAEAVGYMCYNFSAMLSPVFECFVERADTDNIDAEELGTELTYLFISGHPYFMRGINECDYHSSCIDFFISELLVDLYDFAECCISGKTKYKSLSSEHFLPYHLHFYLDEFSNRNISNFINLLSSARVYGIGFSIMIQCMNQLKSKYPENDDWQYIEANCDTQIFLGSVLPDDIKYFSECTSHGLTIADTTNGVKYKEVRDFTEQKIREDIMGRDKILVLVRDSISVACDRLDPEKYKGDGVNV